MVDHSALDRLIAAYGGLALWRRLKGIVLQVDSLGGPLPLLKGLGRTFSHPGMVTVDPLHWRVEFHDYPQAGERAIFSSGTVQLINRSGDLVLDRPHYRETFRGFKK